MPLPNVAGKPTDLPLTAADAAKARAWLQAHGKPTLPSGIQTRGQLLAEVLKMHGRTLEDLMGVDVS